MASRIYTPQALEPEQTLELDASASTHLIKVLRHTVGDPVILFNGDGFNYQAHISKSAKRAQLLIESKSAGLPKSPLNITLVQGISRGDRMDFSIQKAVELGVARIQPVFSEKSKVRLDASRLSKKMQHWEAVAISACEQCGRSDLPDLLPAVSLSDLLRHSVTQTSMVLAFGGHPDLATAARSADGRVSILIGPESGLSDKEIAQAVASGWTPCQLGPRVLRTETATITALSVLQYASGDLSLPPLH